MELAYKLNGQNAIHLQNLFDSYRSVLPNSLSDVLYFIEKRTIGFNKTQEYMPQRHYVDGVFRRVKTGLGKPITPGLHTTRQTWWRKIKTLEDLGIIEVTHANGKPIS